jgi:ubiquitin carboxyl-terminal hydrolase 7
MLTFLSVLVHSGDLNAGHYYAFLRPEKDGPFFKFDDDRVTRATMRETMDENFGGDYGSVVNGQLKSQQARVISLKRSMNAYMLVYLRKNRIDEILPPVTDDDTPAHLREFGFHEKFPATLRK